MDVLCSNWHLAGHFVQEMSKCALNPLIFVLTDVLFSYPSVDKELICAHGDSLPSDASNEQMIRGSLPGLVHFVDSSIFQFMERKPTARRGLHHMQQSWMPAQAFPSLTGFVSFLFCYTVYLTLSFLFFFKEFPPLSSLKTSLPIPILPDTQTRPPIPCLSGKKPLKPVISVEDAEQMGLRLSNVSAAPEGVAVIFHVQAFHRNICRALVTGA